MAVTWNVVALDATKTVGSGDSAVTHNGSSYGAVGLAEADSGSFTAYASITKDKAIAWAKAAMGADQVTAVETSIAAQITESKTPTTTTGVPWS